MPETIWDMNSLFDRCFLQPINALKEIPNNDGALVALAISCFLYERYADAVLQVEGKTSDAKHRISQLAKDFQISNNLAATFWDVIRNGLSSYTKQCQNSSIGVRRLRIGIFRPPTQIILTSLMAN